LNSPSTIGPDLAEVIGVLIGDGCLGRYEKGRHVNWQVVFTAGADEFWYYAGFVKPTIEATFGVSGHLYLRNDNTTRYHIYSKEVATFFANLGLPIGKKHDASIPSAILEQGLVVPFVRGIYHAEGSIYRRYSKRYNRQTRIYRDLLVIQIRTKLRTLMNQIRVQLSTLGIICNRLTEKDGVYTLRITSQAEVSRFMQKIRPKYKCGPSR